MRDWMHSSGRTGQSGIRTRSFPLDLQAGLLATVQPRPWCLQNLKWELGSELKYVVLVPMLNGKLSLTGILLNQHTWELISARNTQHKYNNKDLSRLR